MTPVRIGSDVICGGVRRSSGAHDDTGGRAPVRRTVAHDPGDRSVDGCDAADRTKHRRERRAHDSGGCGGVGPMVAASLRGHCPPSRTRRLAPPGRPRRLLWGREQGDPAREDGKRLSKSISKCLSTAQRRRARRGLPGEGPSETRESWTRGSCFREARFAAPQRFIARDQHRISTGKQPEFDRNLTGIEGAQVRVIT